MKSSLGLGFCILNDTVDSGEVHGRTTFGCINEMNSRKSKGDKVPSAFFPQISEPSKANCTETYG